VLEHVRDAALARRLVLGARVIEDLHGDHGRFVIGHEDDLEPVGKLPLLHLRRVLVGFALGGGAERRRRRHEKRRQEDAAHASSPFIIRFGQYV